MFPGSVPPGCIVEVFDSAVVEFEPALLEVFDVFELTASRSCEQPSTQNTNAANGRMCRDLIAILGVRRPLRFRLVVNLSREMTQRMMPGLDLNERRKLFTADIFRTVAAFCKGTTGGQICDVRR